MSPLRCTIYTSLITCFTNSSARAFPLAAFDISICADDSRPRFIFRIIKTAAWAARQTKARGYCMALLRSSGGLRTKGVTSSSSAREDMTEELGIANQLQQDEKMEVAGHAVSRARPAAIPCPILPSPKKDRPQWTIVVPSGDLQGRWRVYEAGFRSLRREIYDCTAQVPGRDLLAAIAWAGLARLP